MSCPGVAVAGLSGDGGKTLVALGLVAAWTHMGRKVAPYKKGPDYIDAAWLTIAANNTCRNLDTFLMTPNVIKATWNKVNVNSDIALVEGNRGLFDGMDSQGSHSTASLAALLKTPVILVIDVTKMTRTAAAIVLGAKTLQNNVDLAGVVLNRVGGERHEAVVRESIETETGVPVIGAIPKIQSDKMIPGRHLGLVTTDEFPFVDKIISNAREAIENYLDLDLLDELINKRSVDEKDDLITRERDLSESEQELNIGIVRDRAFPFYYPENIESLENSNTKVIEISALEGRLLPDNLHALYLGGGFPETHAAKLSENRQFLDSLKNAADNGLPIYAECGGLMLLSRSFEYEGKNYPMAGIIPAELSWSKKPSGHGYTIGIVDRENPFYKVGTEIRGHEFHYSRIKILDEDHNDSTVVSMERGKGVGESREGFLFNNVLALYTHVHAAGLPQWTEGLVNAAQNYKSLSDRI